MLRGNQPRRLLDALHFSDAIDGQLGSGTREMIANFQAAKGLKKTRTINPETWTELRKLSQ
ncbi:MAG: hypothetical protein COB53_05880 [Elusimicrobia bacterium]|nr:MAG: hypothetical protein COB53_05880 [Elusimicrobiota bacterium]